jgi:hypothetical protein
LEQKEKKNTPERTLTAVRIACLSYNTQLVRIDNELIIDIRVTAQVADRLFVINDDPQILLRSTVRVQGVGSSLHPQNKNINTHVINTLTSHACAFSAPSERRNERLTALFPVRLAIKKTEPRFEQDLDDRDLSFRKIVVHNACANVRVQNQIQADRT